MAGILGSLIVELRANVADFVSGMSGASYAAKKAGSDIEGAFSGVGEVAGALLAPLGELGEQISETFSRVGEWGAAATKELAKFSGEFGLVGTAAGFAVAAIAAVEVAAVGLTLHTAEAAAKLYELSQSTGVSVEALSGFKFVAEQNGVAAETMSLALERMGRSAFAAATAPVGSILAQSNAYARLGISLRDADGSLRSSQDLFEAIAAKFEAMPDGIAKSALAIEIFGRGGAALIPVLDRGRDGIDALLAEAQKLGVVMSTDTASAAEEFEGRLNVMKSAAEGAADELLVKMLPASSTSRPSSRTSRTARILCSARRTTSRAWSRARSASPTRGSTRSRRSASLSRRSAAWSSRRSSRSHARPTPRSTPFSSILAA